jgi:hypothetical protein
MIITLTYLWTVLRRRACPPLARRLMIQGALVRV